MSETSVLKPKVKIETVTYGIGEHGVKRENIVLLLDTPYEPLNLVSKCKSK